jgi:hypothetical protein
VFVIKGIQPRLNDKQLLASFLFREKYISTDKCFQNVSIPIFSLENPKQYSSSQLNIALFGKERLKIQFRDEERSR